MQGRVLDGDLITGWEKRQVLKEDNGNISQTAKSPAERKRAQRERERKREQNGDCHGASRNVTHMSRRVTTDKDTDKSMESTITGSDRKAKQLPKSAYVISNQYGNRYMYKGFNEMWVEARNRAGKISGILTDFTFHDLKAKGISDYEGSSRDKQLFSGHKTEGQVLIYDRKVKVSPTLDVPLPENIPRKYSK